MDALDRMQTLTVAMTLGVLAVGCAGTATEPELGARPSEAMEEIERTKQAASETDAAARAEGPDAVEDAAPAVDQATPEPIDRTKPVHFATANPEKPRAAQPTLFEASEAARLERRDNPENPSTLVITDANLDEYAKGGQLTEMTREGSDDADDPNQASLLTPVAGQPAADPETYWRTRVRDSRLAWRAAADRVVELEREVAKLRYDFYAQDDPAYRNLEIKPAWDRAAVDLTQARLRVADLEIQVEQIQVAGVEAGALPGWLREGLEFEPEREGEGDEGTQQFGVAESIEPPIMDDPPR